jgi:hypothetical protein
MIKSKKAESTPEAIAWIMRFIILGIVSFIIVAIVLNKYDEKYDVRSAEATILSGKIANCIALVQDKEFIDKNYILGCAGISPTYLLSYFSEINVSSLDSGFNKSITFGNQDLRVECGLLEKNTELKKAPSCSKSNYFVLINKEKFSVRMEVDIGKYAKNLQ